MNWTTPRELKAQLVRLWDRGELLRPLADGQARFPLRLDLRRPTSVNLTDRFEDVRRWAADIAVLQHVRVDKRDVRHRVQGEQRLPDQVWVETADDAFAWLGKRREAARFAEIVATTRAQMPVLMPWLVRRPLAALDLADAWERLMAVVQWVIDHPRPEIYLRQVDVPGVHSKFIEQHRGVLGELLDLALPADAVDRAQSGTNRFGARYGFRDKPVRIRCRVLDAQIEIVPGAPCADITLDVESFSRMRVPLRRVIVTENETNFLCLPAMQGSLALFGAGYGWEALAAARWLADCELIYWGDIDTHGFAILDALRARFSQAVSALMDRETLLSHRMHWTEEPDPVRHDLPRLNETERALYDDLRYDRLGESVRLEQERIGYAWAVGRLGS